VADDLLPLSSEQRLLLLGAAVQRAPIYTIFYGYRVTGPLDVDRLGDAVRRLAAAVPMLRSVFEGNAVFPDAMRVLPERDDVFVDAGTVSDPEAYLAELAGRPVTVTADPLFQVTVARHGDEHVVSGMWHHTIADAWSVSLTVRWLGQLYADPAATVPGGADRWPDYVREEEAAVAALTEPGRFWQDQFEGAEPAVLAAGNGAAGSGYAAAVVTEVAAAGFPRRCRQVGGTPGAVLLTAAALTGADRAGGPVVVPTMLANREPAYENAVGLFMRTSLLRGEAPADRTVAEARTAVLRQIGGCWRHRYESLLSLVERSEKAAAAMAGGPMPFFAQVLDVPRRQLELAGCAVEQVFHGFERTVRFGTELHLRPQPDGSVEAAFVYDTASHERVAVEAAAGRYRDWVAVLTDPAAADLPLAKAAPPA
jgi:Condensation domain